MTQISKFYDITVSIDSDSWSNVADYDSVPHEIYAEYRDNRAVYDLDGQIVNGTFPPSGDEDMKLWIAENRSALEEVFATKTLLELPPLR